MSKSGYLMNTVADLATSFTVAEIAKEFTLVYRALANEDKRRGDGYNMKMFNQVSKQYEKIYKKYKYK